MSKDVTMDIDWRTVQLFVGPEGVSEVSVAAHNNSKVRCTCKTFSTSARCKHSKYVKDVITKGGGNYVVQIPEDVPDEDAIEAMGDSAAWREFVLKYAKVEVID